MWETIAASEALLGAVIGGTIGLAGGLAGSVTLLVFDHRKWRADRKLEHLRIKKSEMEARFKRLREALPDAMAAQGPMSTEILDLTMACPRSVERAILAYVRERTDQEGTDMDAKRVGHHYHLITSEMTAALRQADKQIDDAV